MRTYIGDQEALDAIEFQELACGFGGLAVEDFRELFVGPPEESPTERAARLAVAGEVYAELQEQRDADEIAMLNALYASQLSGSAPFRRRAGRRKAIAGRAA